MALSINKKPKKQGSAPNLSFNPDILDVNLVKDEVAVEFDWRRHILFTFVVLVLAAALVAEIYYGLSWWQKQEEERAEGLKAEHATISRQIKNINANAKDFVGFRDKLSLTEQLMDNHIYWTNFFNWLERNTLNSVTYTNFDGDISGDYIMSAQGSKFSDVSWQTKSFKDSPMVVSVRVDEGVSGKSDERAPIQNNSVLFDIVLKVKPEIFYNIKEVSEVTEPIKTVVTEEPEPVVQVTMPEPAVLTPATTPPTDINIDIQEPSPPLNPIEESNNTSEGPAAVSELEVLP